MKNRTLVSRRGVPTVLAVLLAAGCSERPLSGPDQTPDFSHGANPEARHVFVCKEGSGGTFDILNGDVGTVTVAQGTCEEVASHPGDQSTIEVTITETMIPAGFALDGVTIEDYVADGTLISRTHETGPTVTVVLADDHHIIVTYVNSAAPCGECKGGVTELTLRNDGPDGVIRVEGGKGGKVLFDAFVASGATFSFSGMEKDGKMGKEIRVFANGEETEIHTSCSKPIGPGTIFGVFVVVEAFSKDNGRVCPPGEAGLCEVGKPAVLTMVYTGEDCSATSHMQDAGKVECTGDPALASPVRIRASNKENLDDNKAEVWFDGAVALNQAFDLEAAAAGKDDLASNTWVHVFPQGGLMPIQTVEFHTSCSQPLELNDQFGSLELVGFVPRQK